MAELISTLFEEVITEAFRGLFCIAPNRSIRRLKILAWISLVASVTFVTSAFVVQQGWFPPIAFLSGAVSGVAFLVFAIWASVARRRFDLSREESKPAQPVVSDRTPIVE